KAAVRRGGQPWSAPMQGWPPTARPRPRPLQVGGWLQPGLARKGRRLRAEALPMGAAIARGYDRLWPARGHSRLQRDARKGGRLQGARKGLPLAASLDANRGSSGCQRARAVVACVGAAAAQRGKEGLGHPLEKRMILPL
ncbi:hypothetical protein BHM03_00014139, partial [Ensete ventricosum]